MFFFVLSVVTGLLSRIITESLFNPKKPSIEVTKRVEEGQDAITIKRSSLQDGLSIGLIVLIFLAVFEQIQNIVNSQAGLFNYFTLLLFACGFALFTEIKAFLTSPKKLLIHSSGISTQSFISKKDYAFSSITNIQILDKLTKQLEVGHFAQSQVPFPQRVFGLYLQLVLTSGKMVEIDDLYTANLRSIAKLLTDIKQSLAENPKAFE